MSRRVVVTGVGLVSPVGIGTEDTWQAIRNGKSGVARIAAMVVADTGDGVEEGSDARPNTPRGKCMLLDSWRNW